MPDGVLLFSYANLLRGTRAALVLQKYVRMWIARTHYQQQRSAAITIQCFLRSYMARQQFYKVMWYLTLYWRVFSVKFRKKKHKMLSSCFKIFHFLRRYILILGVK